MIPEVSVVIPTFGREDVLVRTLEGLGPQVTPRHELIVVDQSESHAAETIRALESMVAASSIRWIRLSKPSIPGAMNRGLLEARGRIVLFLDDDIEPQPDLLQAHADSHRGSDDSKIVAGQVLQPGEVAEELRGAQFSFRSSIAQQVDEFMGGNFSVPRRFAIEVGGFDESFRGAAYRFEAEFSIRAQRAGSSIRFEPRAGVRHLRAPAGGTRAVGNHLETPRPHHTVGEYYFLLRCRPNGWFVAMVRRPIRAVGTRYHRKRPWRIPGSLIAELAGLLWAVGLASRKPALLPRDRSSQGTASWS
ncbi:MAG: hypothetical protein AMXMBFR36_17790 [Acidobacteriota bacterium]